MHKSMKWLTLAFALALLMAPALAYADCALCACKPSPWVNNATYHEKIAGKFVFGLQNVLLGWTEIFTQPVDNKKEGKCPLAGFGQGLINAIGQTAGGALHVGTFFLPVDVPLPEGGTQLLKH